MKNKRQGIINAAVTRQLNLKPVGTVEEERQLGWLGHMYTQWEMVEYQTQYMKLEPTVKNRSPKKNIGTTCA